MIDREQEYVKMEATEEKLWWYRILHHLVLKTLKKNKIPKNAGILDAGCGTGGLMNYLSKKGYSKIKGIDLSNTAVERCKNKGLNVSQASIDDLSQHFKPDSFDVIISNDVLCYFEKEEQESVIKEMSVLLKTDGILMMNLPSFKAFSGMHDLGVEIVHRFNRSDFKRFEKIENIQIAHYFFWPFLLSPLIYLIRSWQRIQLKFKPQKEIKSDVAMPPPFLNQLFYMICRVELFFSSWSLFGSSTFLTLKKTSDA